MIVVRIGDLNAPNYFRLTFNTRGRRIGAMSQVALRG